MNKIQILVGSVYGGAEQVAEILSAELSKLGHEVSLNTYARAEDLARDPNEVIPRNNGDTSERAHLSTASCGSHRLPGRLFDDVSEVRDLVVNRSALFDQLGDFGVGVHDGGVIPADELPNFGK